MQGRVGLGPGFQHAVRCKRELDTQALHTENIPIRMLHAYDVLLCIDIIYDI